ncbi:hypothetical protein ILUMI_18290 [Ignelater luminosus]|uniref:Uncharacterized protein n=1 Tax=Ignelater luminosus TaxID=2038154 RepID=A0A8K0CNW0_IGNLU|nr:hypothetical protein ILUMI_18290 [Ignelater luminosus]
MTWHGKGLRNINESREKKGSDIMSLRTWNTRSIQGKKVELSVEFERAKLDILYIPETKEKEKAMQQ